MKKWTVKSSEKIFQSSIIDVHKDVCQLPDGKEMPGYYVVGSRYWVSVIALTSANSSADQARARESGFDEFLVKFNSHELISCLRRKRTQYQHLWSSSAIVVLSTCYRPQSVFVKPLGKESICCRLLTNRTTVHRRVVRHIADVNERIHQPL